MTVDRPTVPGRPQPVSAENAETVERPGIARLERDNVTFAGYAALGGWGWVIYSMGAFLPLLRAEEQTNRTVMGLHGTAMAFGGLLCAFFTVPIVRRLHRRGAFLVGSAALGASVLLLLTGHRAEFTVPAMILVGIGGTLMVNSANPMLSVHHGRAGAAALTEANGVGAGIGLLAPLAVGTAQAQGLGWRPAVALVVPVLMVGAWFISRIPRGTLAVDDQLPPAHHRQGRLSTTFWLTVASLVLAVSIEVTSVGWTADLLSQQVGLSLSDAAKTVTGIVIGIAVGRAVIGPASLRFSVPKLFIGAVGLAMLGWLLTWLATTPAMAIAGLVLMGLGISAHFPLGTALTYRAAGANIDRASGIASIGLSLSATVLPMVFGMVADRTSTHWAFCLIPCLAAVAVALQIAARLAHRRGLDAAAPAAS